ncbi:MAG TPA: hypothetical protein PKK11_07035 [Methanothrix sp.]|nr:hypothetical protein [Methanothrix sp.]HPT20016.1 hypothetical protein [Methanothrix sp.]
MSIEEAIKKHQDRLLSNPNVSRLGVGEEEGEEVILVFVKKSGKVSDIDLRESIPRMIDGFRTVVRKELKLG